MNSGLKWGAYLALLVFGLFSGYRLKQVLSGRALPAPAKTTAKYVPKSAATNAPLVTNTTPSSNVAAVFTNILGLAQNVTNRSATNAALTSTNSSQAAGSTNGVISSNSAPPALEEASPTVSEPAAEDGTSAGALHKGSGLGKRPGLGLWIGCTLFAVIGLGLLIAYDVAQFTGKQAIEVLYQDERPAMRDEEYDEAEKSWAAGDHLEAIRQLRDYLKNNPREIHAALRIAEIYEKDLSNPLAAALEYEEILKAKLKPEKWGWSAIHLCNLYFKLDQEDKAVALLGRLDMEYSQTGAAEKARKRLRDMGLPLPSEAKFASSDEPQSAEDSHLPPGFRRKK